MQFMMTRFQIIHRSMIAYSICNSCVMLEETHLCALLPPRPSDDVSPVGGHIGIPRFHAGDNVATWERCCDVSSDQALRCCGMPKDSLQCNRHCLNKFELIWKYTENGHLNHKT